MFYYYSGCPPLPLVRDLYPRVVMTFWEESMNEQNLQNECLASLMEKERGWSLQLDQLSTSSFSRYAFHVCVCVCVLAGHHFVPALTGA